MSQVTNAGPKQQLITKYCSGTDEDSPIKRNVKITSKKSSLAKPRPLSSTKSKPGTSKTEINSPVLREWLKKPTKPNKTSPKKPKKMTKFNRNDSFEEECRKNDLKMGSLLKTIQQNAKYIKCMDEIREMDKHCQKRHFSERLFEESTVKKPLDCYEMTDEEIKEALHNNLDYLTAIKDGTIPNRRHDLFTQRRRNLTLKNAMTYNVSMIAFKTEHKKYLADKLSGIFCGNGDYYYYEVLLPELCLKIFMDRYNMSYDEAYKYLDEAPVVE